MSNPVRFVLLAISSLLLVHPAWAESESHPCTEDIQKYCADVQPGAGRVRDCLKAHETNLSRACKEHGEEVREKVENFKDACGADLKKFCGDTQEGGGRKIACLKRHRAELTPECATEVAQIKRKHPQSKTAAGAGPSASPDNASNP